MRWKKQTDLYHALTWPSLSYVAEDPKGRIVGYILAKMCVSSMETLLSSKQFSAVCLFSQGRRRRT